MAFGHIIPRPEIPDTDDGYLEELAKNIFRVGFNWIVVEEHWPDIQEAFTEFQIAKVAAFTDEDVARLVDNSKIIRHRKKIGAIIANAQLIKAIVNEHGSFGQYLATFRNDPYPVRRDRIADSFRHLGKTGAFCFLYCVNEKVPSWDDRFTEV